MVGDLTGLDDRNGGWGGSIAQSFLEEFDRISTGSSIQKTEDVIYWDPELYPDYNGKSLVLEELQSLLPRGCHSSQMDGCLVHHGMSASVFSLICFELRVNEIDQNPRSQFATTQPQIYGPDLCINMTTLSKGPLETIAAQVQIPLDLCDPAVMIRYSQRQNKSFHKRCPRAQDAITIIRRRRRGAVKEVEWPSSEGILQ